MRSFDHEKLQEHLKSSGTTVQEFYKKIWISDTPVYSIKNGRVKITKIQLLLNICNELDIDPRDLFIKV